MMGSEKMIPNQATLVHVEEPEFDCNKKAIIEEEEIQYDSEGLMILPSEYVSETTALLALRTAGDTCPDPALYAKSELREILNLLLPPKQWIDCDRLWEQQVSSEQALRPEVKEINENLTRRLADREAKETGVCMVRRELYNQVFDELIREITVMCPERGLLLLRVRNELRMSLDANRSVYESSKFIVTPREESIDSVDPEETAELELKISGIELEKSRLKNQIQALTDNMALKEIKHNELVEAETKKHTEEVEFLEKVQKQLQRQLELFTGPSPHIQKTGTLLNALFAKKDEEAAAAAAAAAEQAKQAKSK